MHVRFIEEPELNAKFVAEPELNMELSSEEEILVGEIQDVRVNGTSVVEDHVAYIEIPENLSWNNVTDKPFNTIGQNLIVTEQGALKVETTDNAEEDNTRPITSAGTYTLIGNINTLLQSI